MTLISATVTNATSAPSRRRRSARSAQSANNVSPRLPASTSWTPLLRARMICSTVSPPSPERRCPAKTPPTSSSIRFCAERNRQAALATDTASAPAPKTHTARTVSRITCRVTQPSAISAFRNASESMCASCLIGSTKLP